MAVVYIDYFFISIRIHNGTADCGGWTIVTNSLVNNFGSTLTPFNISYNDLLNVGVGTPSVNSNYQISLIQYRLLANANHKVDYVWYAKSGKSSDPWIKTIGYNNHYLDNSVDFIWYGNLVYFSYGGVAYNGMSISTYDRDKDLLSSVSCVDTYGSLDYLCASVQWNSAISLGGYSLSLNPFDYYYPGWIANNKQDSFYISANNINISKTR